MAKQGKDLTKLHVRLCNPASYHTIQKAREFEKIKIDKMLSMNARKHARPECMWRLYLL